MPSSAFEVTNTSILDGDERTWEGKKWQEGTAKAIVYLESAHQAFGTRLGITIVGPKFARLLHLGSDLIALECGVAFFANLSSAARCQLASVILTTTTNLDHLPHNLSHQNTHGFTSIHRPAFSTLYVTYTAAFSTFLGFPARPSDLRIPQSPDGVFTSNVINRATKHNFSTDRERFEVMKLCRRDVTWKAEVQALSGSKRTRDREDEGSGSGTGESQPQRRSARLSNQKKEGAGASESSGGKGQVDQSGSDQMEHRCEW